MAFGFGETGIIAKRSSSVANRASGGSGGRGGGGKFHVVDGDNEDDDDDGGGDEYDDEGKDDRLGAYVGAGILRCLEHRDVHVIRLPPEDKKRATYAQLDIVHLGGGS